MSESDNLQKLGESLRSVMGSPEFEGILKSFGAGNTNGDSAYCAGGTGAAQAAGSAGGAAQNEVASGAAAQIAGLRVPVFRTPQRLRRVRCPARCRMRSARAA